MHSVERMDAGRGKESQAVEQQQNFCRKSKLKTKANAQKSVTKDLEQSLLSSMYQTHEHRAIYRVFRAQAD
jgi:hypothetical protein